MTFRTRYKLLLTFSLLLGFASCGSSSSSQYGNSAVVDDVEEFSVDRIDVLLRGNPASPVVSAVMFIRGGSSALPSTTPISTEYFAMNVVSESGTEMIGKPWYRRKLLSMGTGISGEDGRDYSAISMRCVRENFDTSWAYFSQIMTNPVFDAVEFENFKRNVLLGLDQRRTNADVMSRVIADSIFFSGHAYGRQLNREDVQAQSLQNIQQHYKSIMVKSRLLLSVVGNISKAELKEKIKQTLSKLPEGEFSDPKLSAPPQAFKPSATLVQLGRKLPTHYAIAYYLIPSKGDPDYYPYIRLRNFFGGFVFNHIRVQHNLAYAPNVDDAEGKTSTGMISFQTPYVDSAARIVFDDVDFFQNNRIRESAIREGVGRWTTSNLVKTETGQSQAVLIGQAKIMTGDWRNAFVSYEKLASVTPEQLQNVARKYLRNFNWVVVGDTTDVDGELLRSR